jgi:exo-beta-1,3-glucanase (GH17 family)
MALMRASFRASFLLALMSLGIPAHPFDGKGALLSLKAPAIAYQPKDYSPGSDAVGPATAQIRSELRLLRTAGFRGLVTYGSKGAMGLIPEIARSEGFDDIIIMGIWDVDSMEEWRNALAQTPFVNGYCVGNEGLGIRYDTIKLESRMLLLKKRTGLPVTTSEPIFRYLQGSYLDWLWNHSDWLFPNVHAFLDKPIDANKAVEWIVAHHDYLTALTGRNLIIKEAGFPTAGYADLNEDSQVVFFEALKATGINFFYFEAFDQPWKETLVKSSPIEAHWGLFYKTGKPKKFALKLITNRE